MMFFNFKGKGQYGGTTIGGTDVTFQVLDDDSLVVSANGVEDVIQPKRNDWGRFYVATLDDKRYFVSQRENDKGKYLQCKPAPERQLDADNGQAPTTYGGRAS
jgi:hypothetical protein